MVNYVNTYERWTEAECDFLRENYGTTFVKFLAIRMGRSPNAIRTHAYTLDLARPNRRQKKQKDRIPPASSTCYLRKGEKVLHRFKKHEYVLLGPVFHTNLGTWFAAERTLCYSNPRAPRRLTRIKADSLILLSEYRKWYEATHAGCKPPIAKEGARL